MASATATSWSVDWSSPSIGGSPFVRDVVGSVRRDAHGHVELHAGHVVVLLSLDERQTIVGDRRPFRGEIDLGADADADVPGDLSEVLELVRRAYPTPTFTSALSARAVKKAARTLRRAWLTVVRSVAFSESVARSAARHFLLVRPKS